VDGTREKGICSVSHRLPGRHGSNDMNDEGHFCHKVALGRLLPRRVIRDQIERTAETLQTLAARGSLVATTAVIQALERGLHCPPLRDPTWWRTCITSCGRLQRAQISVKYPEIAQVVTDLYDNFSITSGHAEVYYDGMWAFISSLVNELQDACKRMVASTFHTQLIKAFHREAALYRATSRRRISKKVLFLAIRAAMRQATRHNIPLLYPEDCPVALQQKLEERALQWSERFAGVLPCPTAEFILGDSKMLKTEALIEWLFVLQEHRVECLQRMALLLPPHLPGPDGTAEACFPRNSMKAQALLPLCSLDVRHVSINPSTLVGLVNACVGRGELAEEFRIQSKVASLKHFFEFFPGLHVWERRTRYRDDAANFQFRGLRTDGVSASLLFGPELCCRKRKRVPEESGDVFDDRPLSPPTPVQPLEAKARLISIDPGRRDMIYAIIDTKDGRQSRYRLPTSHYLKRTQRSKFQEFGEENLRRVRLPDGRSLYSANCSLPTRKDVFAWTDFLVAYLPLLDDLLRAKRRRCLRRTKYDQFLRRDKVLDEVIKELLGGTLAPSARKETQVALGMATTRCSTGFGYAPASQGRLYWRLTKVHGIEVTLVDEFRTSQNCSRCNLARLYRVWERGKHSWQLKACPLCSNAKRTGPLVWQRDHNAAQNIRACFLFQHVRGETRPGCMQRGVAPTSLKPSDFSVDMRHEAYAHSIRFGGGPSASCLWERGVLGRTLGGPRAACPVTDG
jgi:Putative transposase DNA-binding domain